MSIIEWRPVAYETPDDDGRYRVLLAPADWARLPRVVRRRFSARLAPGEVKLYSGVVLRTSHAPAGRLLALLGRLVGGPLPLPGVEGPAVVGVTEHPMIGGQVWTRVYARAAKFPQVIHSAKRFAGPSGLEEYLGYGLIMRLTLHVIDEALVFRSAGYALAVGRRRIPMPSWLSPGLCEIVHRDQGEGRFEFSLRLTHPYLGLLIDQVAMFRDASGAAAPAHPTPVKAGRDLLPV